MSVKGNALRACIIVFMLIAIKIFRLVYLHFGKLQSKTFTERIPKIHESKCNLLKVSSEPLRACQEGDNDIAISQMLPDQQPYKLSVSVARQVAPCALGLRWLAASVSRILVVQD